MKIEFDLTDAEASDLRELIRDAASREHPGPVKLWKAIEKAKRIETGKLMRQIFKDREAT